METGGGAWVNVAMGWEFVGASRFLSQSATSRRRMGWPTTARERASAMV